MVRLTRGSVVGREMGPPSRPSKDRWGCRVRAGVRRSLRARIRVIYIFTNYQS